MKKWLVILMAAIAMLAINDMAESEGHHTYAYQWERNVDMGMNPAAYLLDMTSPEMKKGAVPLHDGYAILAEMNIPNEEQYQRAYKYLLAMESYNMAPKDFFHYYEHPEEYVAVWITGETVTDSALKLVRCGVNGENIWCHQYAGYASGYVLDGDIAEGELRKAVHFVLLLQIDPEASDEEIATRILNAELTITYNIMDEAGERVVTEPVDMSRLQKAPEIDLSPYSASIYAYKEAIYGEWPPREGSSAYAWVEELTKDEQAELEEYPERFSAFFVYGVIQNNSDKKLSWIFARNKREIPGVHRKVLWHDSLATSTANPHEERGFSAYIYMKTQDLSDDEIEETIKDMNWEVCFALYEYEGGGGNGLTYGPLYSIPVTIGSLEKRVDE